MAYTDDLAGRIQQRMDLLRLNAYSAALKAGVGQDYIRDILRGRTKNPSAEKLGKLAVALETTINFLLGQEEEMPQLKNFRGEILPPPPEPSAPGELPQNGADLLPVRFELMADVWRPASQVVNQPIGYEPAVIPPAYADRECWWELIRDESISRYAPAGSLVLVAEMKDSERHLVEENALVVVQKRLTFEDGAVHLVERSARQVFPDGALRSWFMGYASVDSEQWPDWTDEYWRDADLGNFDDEARAEIAARAKKIREQELAAMDPGLREALKAPNERTREGLKKMEAFMNMSADEVKTFIQQLEQRRFRLVGRIIRVLVPVAPGADFGIKTRLQ